MAHYYEIEDIRRSINRKMWVVISVLAVVSLFSLFSAIVAFARPVPVVAIDSSGKPILFSDTVTPRQTMTDMRVRYFAKEFSQAYIGINSSTLEQDLAKSINWMTPEYRHVVASDVDELARRQSYKDKNVRTRFTNLEVKIGKYAPEQLDGRIYALIIGRMIFEPIMGQLTEQQEISRWFLAKLVLQRVPVTENTIFGLLVHYVEQHYFESKAEYETYLVKQSAAH